MEKSEKICTFCGKEIFKIGFTFSDGYICSDCAKEASPLLLKDRCKTAEDFCRHIEYRRKNAEKLADFYYSKTFGDYERIHTSTIEQCLVINKSADFSEGNPDIIYGDKIFEIKTSVENEGDIYKFAVTLRVDSPWFDEVKAEIFHKEMDFDKYRECEKVMEQLLFTIKTWLGMPNFGSVNTAPVPGYVKNLQEQFLKYGGMTPPKEEGWVCSFCKTHNKGNFCGECGKPKH